MTEKTKELRVNISLTGDSAKLFIKLHEYLQQRHTPVKVANTDVVSMALALLDANLNK